MKETLEATSTQRIWKMMTLMRQLPSGSATSAEMKMTRSCTNGWYCGFAMRATPRQRLFWP